MENDKELYNEFLNGNQESFDKLIYRYRNYVVSFINGFVKNKDIAEDLAQDTFVYILINKKEYDFKYSLKTYLYTIARSRALNYLKREKRIVPLNENDIYTYDTDDEFVKTENRERVNNAINKLSENHRQAIYLADIEDMSYKDISKVIGKTIPQTKMLIYRARKKLKLILKKEEKANE